MPLTFLFLKEVGRMTCGGTRCVVAPGDWNNTPSDLKECGLLDALGLTCVLPNGEQTTNATKGT